MISGAAVREEIRRLRAKAVTARQIHHERRGGPDARRYRTWRKPPATSLEVEREAADDWFTFKSASIFVLWTFKNGWSV